MSRSLISRIDPKAVADILLYSALHADADLLELVPAHGGVHQASLMHGVGPLGALELESNFADAVIARLALIAGLDFTAGEERYGSIRVRCDPVDAELRISVRSAGGHLAAEIRKPLVRATVPRARSLEKPHTVGEYVLKEELGRGALGAVYRAEHRLLRRPAAVKVWTLPNVALSRANAALLREARAAAATRHPGVVEIYDILQLEDGRVAVVMEMLEGETLSARISRQGALPIAEAVELGRRVVEVLQATEAHGIVHRDIKPENVFLLRDGRVKVLDFGAAMQAGGDERPGTLGTPWYMAPEQGEGERPDRRADVYSFGCVLFEMVTGRCPYDGRDPNAVMALHREQPIPVPTSPYGPVPEGLERLIMRALAKRPEGRQQSAGELYADLGAVTDALNRPGFRKWLPL